MFTNLSHAQQVSATLLGHFGKSTNVLMEVHGHTIRVRRADNNSQIARLYVQSYDLDLVVVSGIDSSEDKLPAVQFHGFGIEELSYLAMFIENSPRFPKLYDRAKRWSPIRNKIVEGAY